MINRTRMSLVLSIFTAFIFFQSTSTVEAGEWQIVGPRALGMGGANVAVANDETAAYWNPGAFGFFKNAEDDYYGKRRWSATLSEATVGAQTHDDFGETLSKFTEINFDGIDDNNLTSDKVTDFISLLSALEEFRGRENQSASIIANARMGVQAGHFGLGAQVSLDVSATPNFDFNNLGPDGTVTFTINEFTDPARLGCPSCSTASITASTLTTGQTNAIDTELTALGWSPTQRNGYINSVDNGLTQAGVPAPADIVAQTVNAARLANTAAGTGGPLSQNQSTLRFKGIALMEIPLTYGHAISNNLSIGGNLKYMKARVYDRTVDILRQDFGDALDDALDQYEEKSNFGIDLGMLYRVGDSFRVGLVGKNLNAPKFGSIKEEAQVRTGIAYQAGKSLTLAADLDLTKNDASAGNTLKSQNIGAGLEFDMFSFLKLRGGIYKNLAESDIGLVYTAGLGLNLWLLQVDIGAAVSEDKTKIDDSDIWEEARAAFALTMLF